jgi:hypothetical protein
LIYKLAFIIAESGEPELKNGTMIDWETRDRVFGANSEFLCNCACGVLHRHEFGKLIPTKLSNLILKMATNFWNVMNDQSV